MRAICFLTLSLVLLSTQSFGQSSVYKQRSLLSGGRSIGGLSLISIDTSTILGFCTNYSLVKIDVETGTTSIVDYPDVGLATYASHERFGTKIVGLARSTGSTMYTIEGGSPPSKLESWTGPLTFLDEHLLRWVENGPIVLPSPYGWSDSIVVSLDAGEHFTMIPSIDTTAYTISDFMSRSLLQYRKSDKHWYLIDVNPAFHWTRSPIKGESAPTTAAMSSDSTVYWVSKGGENSATLRFGHLHDTASTLLDSVRTVTGKRKIVPLAVYTLGSGSVMLLDNNGYAYKLEGDSVARFLLQFAKPYKTIRKTNLEKGGYIYLHEWSAAYQHVYRVNLADPPEVDSMRLPPGVNIPVLSYCSNIRGIGIVTNESEPSEHLIQPHLNRVIAFGSLVKEIELLQWRAMTYAWQGPDADAMVVTELGQLLWVDKQQRGVVRRGNVYWPDDASTSNDPVLMYPHRHYREWGTSVPAQVEGGLVFAGPVVRRISLEGDRTDTLLMAPNSFASVLADGRFASGWNNALRIHDGGATNAVALNVPAEFEADSMGYPSAMVQCTDGSLLATFQGTWRKDSSAAGKRLFRWGGTLKSNDDGSTWQPKPLPVPECNYVQHVMRTVNGTLLASCMRMVEDSTPAFPSGTDPAAETQYTANRITILRSVDCGESWTEVHTPFYNGPWQMNAGNIVQQSDGRLFAALLPGVYTSTDDGVSWHLDVRVNALIVPVSLTLNDDESLLLSANDGVYRLDKLTGVAGEEQQTTRRNIRMEVLTPEALQQRLASGKVEHATLVDLQGRETPLVSGGIVINDVILLLLNGVYGLDVNGERSVVCVKTN